jgi:selenide, water dikinase
VLSDDLALVQTVDFFAPIVDDPFTFGQIAAANALSDVYAMGGTPVTAMNIVCFPAGKLPPEVLGDILRGGQEKVHEAGAVVVGGHSIIDEEIKYGLSVTGTVHPDRMLTNAAAKPGDVLVLTKALGTGILATALKQGTLDQREGAALFASMSALNRQAAASAVALGVRCATDITGFGLLGHASHIAKASGVTLVIAANRLPLLPHARSLAERGVRTGGAERNAPFVAERVRWGAASEVDRALMLDPQTSGGLLVAISPARVAEYLSRVPGSVQIGEVEPDRGVSLVVV